jgi:hypothetical protein
MLREVVNKHIKPRLVPYRLTLSSTAANNVLRAGYGDYTLSRASAGVATLAHKEGFSRNGFLFGTPDYSQAEGAYLAYGSTSGTSSSYALKTFDSGGVAADLSLDGITFGWDSTDLSLTKIQRVACTVGYSRIIWGKITGATGAVAIGKKDFTCTRSSQGVYAITFQNAFATTPVVLISPIATGSNASAVISTNAGSRTASTVGVVTSALGASPSDFDFYIAVIGSDSRSDIARARYPLFNSQRKPRIVACQITNTGGTPTLTIGGATGGIDFTNLTDNGAGDFSVTIAEPFKREPAIFVMTSSQRSQVHSYSNNVIRVLTQNAGGTNTDVNGVTHILAIGSDVLDEF